MSPINPAEREAWVALAAVDGVGEATLGRLIASFGSATSVLTMAGAADRGTALRELRAAAEGRLPAETAARIREAARDPGRVASRLRELGGWSLTPFDPDYPSRLRTIAPVPPVLFGAGDVAAIRAPRSVAVVGTRSPTVPGRLIAARISTRLVECDAVVVSGMAIGVDGAAHAAALDAGGRTVAVIGGGLARPGPRAHGPLAARIIERGGAVLGELPPDARPTKGTFPRRNRIISGLSDATIVVEAPLRSGALITARHAFEQGRAVLVAPGRPGDPQVSGCNALLRETPARPITTLDELVVDLGFHLAHPPRTGSNGRRLLGASEALALLNGPERAVAARLTHGAASLDALASAVGQPPSIVAGALTLLQLRGWCQPIGPLNLPAGPLLRTSSP
jgi:DNA processing protein